MRRLALDGSPAFCHSPHPENWKLRLTRATRHKIGEEMTSFGTLLYTWAKGRLVGTDTNGNRYYIERSAPKGQRAKRWVVFSGAVEASTIPPEWHAWLHHTTDKPLTDMPRQPWQKAHEPNHTGTGGAYLPPGHDLRGGKRERAAGDYEAWQP